MSNDIHVMVDLETLGTSHDAAVIAIGAVVFNPRGLSMSPFYERTSPTLAEKYGSVDRETMLWWDKEENKQARAEAFGGTKAPAKVWCEFYNWLEDMVGASELDNPWNSIYPWANGADFDLPIIQHHFLEFTGEYPINFRNHRCYRTLKSLVREEVYEGVAHAGKHNALHDAMYQTEVARRCMSALGYW